MGQENIGLYPDTLGDRLKLLMEEHGDSKNELADDLGISASNLNYYLSNRHLPQAKGLMKIANRYHVSIDWLLCMPNALRSSDIHADQIAEITLLSKQSVNLLMNDPSEYDVEQRRAALDFILNDANSTVFLDALATALAYLKESAKYPNSPQGILDPQNSAISGVGMTDKKRLDKKYKKAIEEYEKSLRMYGYTSVYLTYYQEAHRCFTEAQAHLSKMFESKENDIKRSLKREKE